MPYVPQTRCFCNRPSPCSVHKPKARSGTRGYEGGAWRYEIAPAFLAKHPRCERCGRPATIPHHDPERRTLVAMGVPSPDAEEYLHALCSSCHSSVHATARNAAMRKAR